MSSVRDRTAEFFAVADLARKRLARDAAAAQQTQAAAASQPNSAGSAGSLAQAPKSLDASAVALPESSNSAARRRRQQSQFSQLASSVGSDIHRTASRLASLTKLAQRKHSLFDDPTKQISELSAVIKTEIQDLNLKIDKLQQIQRADVSANTQELRHENRIVDSLKSRLMKTTKDFKDVLQMRTETVREQQDRRSRYSSAATLAPLGEGGASAYDLDLEGGPDVDGGAGVPQLQLVTAEQHQQSRTTAVESIESTIAELGKIFQQLATMVAEQGEMVNRIDENADNALLNIEEGQNQLTRYWENVSSNRALMVKIFLTVMFFLTLFIVFFA